MSHDIAVVWIYCTKTEFPMDTEFMESVRQNLRLLVNQICPYQHCLIVRNCAPFENVSHPWIPVTFQNCLHYIHDCGRCFNKIHKMHLKTREQKLGLAFKLRKPSWFMCCRCMLVRLRSEDRLSPVPVRISEVTEEPRKNQKKSFVLFRGSTI